MTIMYGKRAVIAFQTNRDIAAGEEITIDYGVDYFDADFPCQCDAFEYPHTSETYRRHVHENGDVSPRGWGTYAPFEGPGGGSMSSQASSGSAEKEKLLSVLAAKTTKVRKNVSRSRRRERVSASKATRRRLSWGSRAYKGGDPDRNPLRRSARIAAAIAAA